ncbi:hypothetical protein [Flavobacterium hydrophilum]|uniref:NADH:ubiquinone oxidoreductase intermediate-associated protein 30 domain-containing protein n=1 Tax=Flavobacterium hydrophilum TaxID=2211445 RepID=A0A2V4C4A3_9FLAO|nr:hypothetical protein [Flavobacterium hydrophilum]PXY45827.1 hypothetical protein DMB68_01145 [Flavobacterium hydrophilum]
MIRQSVLLISSLFIVSGFIVPATILKSDTDLVQSNIWHIAGPVNENYETINAVRQKEGIVRVTAKDNPVGEIELNVLITSSASNDGVPTNLPDNSRFVKITYKSTQLIKLQAREGNEAGTDCVHGGSHPRADLPASPNTFKTIKIPWTHFRQDGLPNGKLLDIHNLCKFNFVNYNPVSGALLEIKSVVIEN